MKIRLGYVALSKALDNITTSSTITYTNYQKLDDSIRNDKLDNIIKSNFIDLEKIINYNIKNNIHFYRLTSKLIPLATLSEVEYEYINEYKKEYESIGKIINNSKMRIDTHPDQFCVLNSVDKKIVDNSISILNYHKNILSAFKIINSKILIHVGSSSFGKDKSISRFINNFNKLDAKIQNMLLLENDDKVYNIVDTLNLCKRINVPMVLDYHHYMCNNNGEKITSYIKEIFDTWNKEELVPKIHFSSPKNKTKKDIRSHHDYINSDDFINFIEQIKFVDRDFDVMIEAKMKDDALFRLVRELKYKTNYKFIDETTFVIE